MDKQFISGGGHQQMQNMETLAKPVPTMHSEPNDLYEETCRRLEHYNSQIDKLSAELKKLTLMRNVLAAAQNAFDNDRHDKPSSEISSREY